MPNTYSIAEAKNRLGSVVHEAEAGPAVELTRRGRPVAMVVSISEYRRLRQPRRTLWDAIEDFRGRYDMEALAIDPEEVWGDARDTSPGKDFCW